jgi:small subunit ribosomal protein S8
MPTSDSIADMLTRIRNAVRNKRPNVRVKRSKVCAGIAQVLVNEGYVLSFQALEDTNQGELEIDLKYGDRGERVIQGLQRESKPGCRVYRGADDLPKVLDGLGISVVSTSRGVMSDRECRQQNVGGELLCTVW